MSRALVIAGHGSHLDPNASAPLYAHAAAIRAEGAFDEVRVATWKEEPSLSRAFDGLDADDITVVPVFMSDGYFTQQVLPRELRLDGPVTCRGGRRIRYTRPIGTHPALARVLAERAREAGATPDAAIAVLGHGTPRNPSSERTIFAQAANLRGLGPWACVEAVFLEQEPHMSRVLDICPRPIVVVVPLFVADGWHAGQTIPEELELDGPETRRNGRILRYTPAVGTHPSVAGVILELAHEAATW
jgi:sirohydrochlorin cobaltochelatase